MPLCAQDWEEVRWASLVDASPCINPGITVCSAAWCGLMGWGNNSSSALSYSLAPSLKSGRGSSVSRQPRLGPVGPAHLLPIGSMGPNSSSNPTASLGRPGLRVAPPKGPQGTRFQAIWDTSVLVFSPDLKLKQRKLMTTDGNGGHPRTG